MRSERRGSRWLDEPSSVLLRAPRARLLVQHTAELRVVGVRQRGGGSAAVGCAEAVLDLLQKRKRDAPPERLVRHAEVHDAAGADHVEQVPVLAVRHAAGDAEGGAACLCQGLCCVLRLCAEAQRARLSVVGSFSRMARATVLALPAVALRRQGRGLSRENPCACTRRVAHSRTDADRHCTECTAARARACTPQALPCGAPRARRESAWRVEQR